MRSRLETLMQTAQQVISTDLHTLNTRYEHTLLELSQNVADYENKVNEYLQKMGFKF